MTRIVEPENFLSIFSPLIAEKKSKQVQYRNDYKLNDIMPQSRSSFTFGSSSVTYGGPNGAYYTSSNTRRMGSDGVS